MPHRKVGRCGARGFPKNNLFMRDTIMTTPEEKYTREWNGVTLSLSKGDAELRQSISRCVRYMYSSVRRRAASRGSGDSRRDVFRRRETR